LRNKTWQTLEIFQMKTILVVLFFFITAGVAAAQNKPNFLFILTDDQSSGLIQSL